MINSKLFLLVVLLCISLVETFAKQESKEKLLLPVLNMQEKYSDEKVNIQDIGKVQYICFKVPDDVFLRRTPSLETMGDKTVLAVLAATPAYMLIKTFLLKHIEGEDKLNEKLYLYASKNKSFSGCEFHNRDFENAGDVFTNFYVANNKLYFILYPYVLLEALENGKLSGELMEITKTLDEEDNPIIMEVSLHIM